jgi:hypothetical protein
VSRRGVLAAVAAAAAGASAVPERAFAMSNGLVSDAWSAISGAPSDLTFPDEFLGTWLCYSTLTQVATPQGEALVQDMAVVRRAQKDVGEQIVYPMRFIRNNQNKVVMDRAWNVARMAEATAKAYNVIESVEWDVDDPNVLTASLGNDGRSVFFRVNQRSEEYPAPDRIETSEVAQIVFDGQNGGYAQTSVSESGSGVVDPTASSVAEGERYWKRQRGRAARDGVFQTTQNQVVADVHEVEVPSGGSRRRRPRHRRRANRVRLPHLLRPGLHRQQRPARDAVHVQARAVQGEQV